MQFLLQHRISSLAMAFFVVVICEPFLAQACGPSPQKVTQEITIQAMPEKVWALVSDFSAMHTWHPDVLNTTVESKLDTQGTIINIRTLHLINGGNIVEKQREMQKKDMKLGAAMIAGDIAVSNYSDALTVRPSQKLGESVVTWVGRFSNQANLMQAPAGQDDATAIAAIEARYSKGLQGLKHFFEETHE